MEKQNQMKKKRKNLMRPDVFFSLKNIQGIEETTNERGHVLFHIKFASNF